MRVAIATLGSMSPYFQGLGRITNSKFKCPNGLIHVSAGVGHDRGNIGWIVGAPL